MKVASANSGITNTKNEKGFNTAFEEALKQINPSLEMGKYKTKEGETLYKIAKYFSAKFQDLSKNNSYFTAREKANGEFNDTGRRLFRVCTEENIKAFQNPQNLDGERDKASDLTNHKSSFEASRTSKATRTNVGPDSVPNSPSGSPVLEENLKRTSSLP